MLFVMLCWAGILAGARFGAQLPKLNPDPLQITVVQRGAQDIPGLQGQAQVRIDDITNGQVLLTLADGKGGPLVAPTPVRESDVMPFKIGGQEFFLHVRKLENELLGDDYAVFDISSKNRWPKSTSAPAGSLPAPVPVGKK